MPRKRYSTEQIVTKLRQAEVELSRGLRTPQVCKKLGVSEQTYPTAGGRNTVVCGWTKPNGSRSSSERTPS